MSEVEIQSVAGFESEVTPLMFFNLNKIDEKRQLVYGRALQEVVDRSGECADYDASKKAFQKWAEETMDASGGKSMGNVREMHKKDSAVGIVKEIHYNDNDRAIDVVAHIVDPVAFEKCLHGVFTGFSVGGSYASKRKENGVTKYAPILKELSIVDRPCVPTARFYDIQKADGTTERREFQSVGDGAEKPPVRIAEHADDQAHKEPEPTTEVGSETAPEIDPKATVENVATVTDPVGEKRVPDAVRIKRLRNLADGKMPNHVEIQAGEMRYPEPLVHKGDVVMFDDVMEKYGQKHMDHDGDGLIDEKEYRGKDRAKNFSPPARLAIGGATGAAIGSMAGHYLHFEDLISRSSVPKVGKFGSIIGGIAGVTAAYRALDKSDKILKAFGGRRRPRFWYTNQNYSYNHQTYIDPRQPQRAAIALSKFDEGQHPRDERGRFTNANDHAKAIAHASATAADKHGSRGSKPWMDHFKAGNGEALHAMAPDDYTDKVAAKLGEIEGRVARVDFAPKEEQKKATADRLKTANGELSQAKRMEMALKWYNEQGQHRDEFKPKDGESMRVFSRRIMSQLNDKFGIDPVKAEYERRRLNADASEKEQADWENKSWRRKTLDVKKVEMFADLFKADNALDSSVAGFASFDGLLKGGSFNEVDHPRDENGRFSSAARKAGVAVAAGAALLVGHGALRRGQVMLGRSRPIKDLQREVFGFSDVKNAADVGASNKGIREDLMNWGKTSGRESTYVVKDGEQKYSVRGNAFNSGLDMGYGNLYGAKTFHNHPGIAGAKFLPPSNTDMFAFSSSRGNVHKIYGLDKSIYSLKLHNHNVSGKTMSDIQLHSILDSLHANSKIASTKSTREEILGRLVSEPMTNKTNGHMGTGEYSAAAHGALMGMHDAGLINYKFRLSDEAKKVLAQHNDIFESARNHSFLKSHKAKKTSIGGYADRYNQWVDNVNYNLFDKSDSPQLFNDLYKFWDAGEHPRDEHGRFVESGHTDMSGAIKGALAVAAAGGTAIAAAIALSHGKAYHLAHKALVDAQFKVAEQAAKVHDIKTSYQATVDLMRGGFEDAIKTARESVSAAKASVSKADDAIARSDQAINAHIDHRAQLNEHAKSLQKKLQEAKDKANHSDIAKINGEIDANKSAIAGTETAESAARNSKAKHERALKAAQDELNSANAKLKTAEENFAKHKEAIRTAAEQNGFSASERPKGKRGDTHVRDVNQQAETYLRNQAESLKADLAASEKALKEAEHAAANAERELTRSKLKFGAAAGSAAVGGGKTFGIPSKLVKALDQAADRAATKIGIPENAIGENPLRSKVYDAYRKAYNDGVKKLREEIGENAKMTHADDHKIMNEAANKATMDAYKLAMDMKNAPFNIEMLSDAYNTVKGGLTGAAKMALNRFTSRLGSAVALVGVMAGSGAYAWSNDTLKNLFSGVTGYDLSVHQTDPNTGKESVWVTKMNGNKRENVTYLEMDKQGNPVYTRNDPEYDPNKDGRLNRNNQNNQNNNGQSGDFSQIMSRIQNARNSGTLQSQQQKESFISNLNMRGLSRDDKKKLINSIGGTPHINWDNMSDVREYISGRSHLYLGSDGNIYKNADMQRLRLTSDYNAAINDRHIKDAMEGRRSVTYDDVPFDIESADGPKLFNDLMKADPAPMLFDDLMKWDASEHPRDDHGRFTTGHGVAAGIASMAALAGAGAAGFFFGRKAARSAIRDGLKNMESKFASRYEAKAASDMEAAKAAHEAALKAANDRAAAAEAKASAATAGTTRKISKPKSSGRKASGAAAPTEMYVRDLDMGPRAWTKPDLDKFTAGTKGKPTTTRTVIESKEFKDSKAGIPISLGVDASGKAVISDIDSKHTLIGGATGSGKSNLMNSVVQQISMTQSPQDVRLVIADMKQNEFNRYDGLPHLAAPVATNQRDAQALLSGVHEEINRRVELFSKANAPDIETYEKITGTKMPRIVFVVDELKDFLHVPGVHNKELSDVARKINEDFDVLMRQGRSRGIGVIAATQYPLKEVVGDAKQSFQNKLAFWVESAMESRVLTGISGAENISNEKGAAFLVSNGKSKEIKTPYSPFSDYIALFDSFGIDKRYHGGAQKADFVAFNDLMKAGSWDESEHPRKPDGEFADKGGQDAFDVRGYSKRISSAADKHARKYGKPGDESYVTAYHHYMMDHDEKYRSEHTQVIENHVGRDAWPVLAGKAIGTVGGTATAILGYRHPTKAISAPVGALTWGALGAAKGFGSSLASEILRPQSGGGWPVKAARIMASTAKGAAVAGVGGFKAGLNHESVGSKLANGIVAWNLVGIPLFFASQPPARFFGEIYDAFHTQRHIEKSDAILFNDLVKWDESAHPRAEGGRFVPKAGPIEDVAGNAGFYGGMAAASMLHNHYAVPHVKEGIGRWAARHIGGAALSMGGGLAASIGAAHLGAQADKAIGAERTERPPEDGKTLLGRVLGGIGGEKAGMNIARKMTQGKNGYLKALGIIGGAVVGGAGGEAVGAQVGHHYGDQLTELLQTSGSRAYRRVFGDDEHSGRTSIKSERV